MPSRGDIALARFPFTDQTGTKRGAAIRGVALTVVFMVVYSRAGPRFGQEMRHEYQR